MNVKFCSIDPSISCTGITIIKMDGDKFEIIEKTSISTGRAVYVDRWKKKLDMHAMFKQWLDPRVEDISFFVFENYAYSAVGAIADLAELNGLYKKYISDAGKETDVIAPATVKRIVGGNGRATKKEVADNIKNFVTNRNISFNNLDESDSAAVGIAYGVSMLEIMNEQEKD